MIAIKFILPLLLVSTIDAAWLEGSWTAIPRDAIFAGFDNTNGQSSVYVGQVNDPREGWVAANVVRNDRTGRITCTYTTRLRVQECDKYFILAGFPHEYRWFNDQTRGTSPRCAVQTDGRDRRDRPVFFGIGRGRVNGQTVVGRVEERTLNVPAGSREQRLREWDSLGLITMAGGC